MQIKCPHCEGVCETDFEPEIGQHVICPFCEVKFSYSGTGHGDDDQEMDECRCPHCGTVYEITTDAVGNSAKCKICNEAFIIKACKGDSSTKVVSEIQSGGVKDGSDGSNKPTQKIQRAKEAFTQKEAKRLHQYVNDPAPRLRREVHYSINSVILALLTISKIIIMLIYIGVGRAIAEVGSARAEVERARAEEVEAAKDTRSISVCELSVSGEGWEKRRAEREAQRQKRLENAHESVAKATEEFQEDVKHLNRLKEIVQFQTLIEMLWLVSFVIFVMEMAKKRSQD